jgi:hypothetical protein
LTKAAAIQRFLGRQCDIHMAPVPGERIGVRHSMPPVSSCESGRDAQKRQNRREDFLQVCAR